MGTDSRDQEKALPEVAFYYPGPMWHSGDRLKNLLLFFDGVALLVPRYMKDRPEAADPVMASPLRAAGLLHLLEPEILVDKKATMQLANAIGELLRSGAFEGLERDGSAFQEISYSRIGSFGDPELAQAVVAELMLHNLARTSEDGVSIPMHPMVRATILVLLVQILRAKGPEIGMELPPTTDRPQLVQALAEMLKVTPAVSTGQVVSFDLGTVAPDLSSVPLDEVLDFRREHLTLFKGYARNVRQFVRDIGALQVVEREQAFRDRQEEILALATDLKKAGQKAWKKSAAFALSLAGAAWTLKTGDAVGAMLAAASAAAGIAVENDTTVSAYSYLFETSTRFHG